MKILYSAVLILAALLISSCEKNLMETPPRGFEEGGNISSVVTITGLNNNDTLRNEVSASVKAIPGAKVDKIELFLDNSIVSSSIKDDLILKWNSLSLPDGLYALKVVVYTSDNKKYEESRSIRIENALLKLDMPQYYNVGLTDIIITDKAGNILSNIKFPVKGDEILYPKTYFSSENINVINVFRWGTLVAVKCDLHVKRGSSWLVKDVPAGYSSSEVFVRLKNIPQFDQINYSTGSGTEGFLTNIADTTAAFGATFYSNPSNKLFVQLESNNKAYYEFFDIAEGEKLVTADISNLKHQSLSKNINVNGEDVDFYIAARFDKNLPYYNRITKKKFTGKTATYFYPGIKTDEYTSQIGFTNKGWRYNYLYKSLLPETVEPMNLSVNSLITNASSLSCNIKGKFDFYTISFISKSGLFYYGVTSCTAIKDYRLPDISSLVSYDSFDLNNLDFRGLYVYDLDKFNGKVLPYDQQFSMLSSGLTPVKIAQMYNPAFGYNVLASADPAFKLK